MIKNDSPSTCLSRLHLGERTIDNSMKSTVIFDKNTHRQQTSNNTRLSEVSHLLKLHNYILCTQIKNLPTILLHTFFFINNKASKQNQNTV